MELHVVGLTLELAQRATELECKEREDVEAKLRDFQTQLSTKEVAQKSEGFHPYCRGPSVEDFGGCEGPFVRICDSYVVGFYKCKEVVLQQSKYIMGVEVPIELDVAPELESKIVEKRPDAFAILQLVKAEDPNVLAKWETGLPTLLISERWWI